MEMPTAEELAGEALREFLRGGTWEGLAREIAWEVVRATGVEARCLEWLTGLVEARLAVRVDGLEFVVERACAAAREEHLRQWPHDRAGGATAAVLEAQEEAAATLSLLYVEVLEWASDVVAERSGPQPKQRARPRLPPLRREKPPVDAEIPGTVAEELTRVRERFGWPRRRAA